MASAPSMAGKPDTLLRIAIHPVSYRASLCRTLSRELAVHAARRADGRGRDVERFSTGGCPYYTSVHFVARGVRPSAASAHCGLRVRLPSGPGPCLAWVVLTVLVSVRSNFRLTFDARHIILLCRCSVDDTVAAPDTWSHDSRCDLPWR